MGSYRLEIASTGRAGCQNKECKDAKVKIQKGELRLGTWVDSERIQAFMWRHWGCVTPKLISNLNTSIEEDPGEGDEKDYTAIDGYDEIPDEDQDKVRSALERGHVDDDDWKGDVEMNRPGKSGFRARKKKTDDAEEGDTADKQETPKSKKRGPAGSKAKAQDEPEPESEAEKPKAKKTKKDTRAKQSAAKEESDAKKVEEQQDKKEEEKTKRIAKKGRPSKPAVSSTEKTSNSNKADGKPAATRSKRKSAAADDEEAAEKVEEPAEEKPKRGRKKRTA